MNCRLFLLFFGFLNLIKLLSRKFVSLRIITNIYSALIKFAEVWIDSQLVLRQSIYIWSQNFRQFREIRYMLLINKLFSPLVCKSSFFHCLTNLFVLPYSFSSIIENCIFYYITAQFQVFLTRVICNFTNHFFIFSYKLTESMVHFVSFSQRCFRLISRSKFIAICKTWSSSEFKTALFNFFFKIFFQCNS